MIEFAPRAGDAAASVPEPTTGPDPRRRKLARLGDRIARLSAHLQAATYRLLTLIREFDQAEGWHEEGFRSCAEWLSWRTGLAPGAAREKVRVARVLASLPHLSAALRSGRLSYSAARALTRVATPTTDAELVDVALHTTAAQLERLVRGWRAADRAEDRERERERHASRELWLLPEPDGSWTIRGRLDPEAGAVLARALEAAGEALYARGADSGSSHGDSSYGGDGDSGTDGGSGDSGIDGDDGSTGSDPEPPSPAPVRRADALGLVAEWALGTGGGGGTGAEAGGTEAGETAPRPVVGRAERFQVLLHVSAETLAGESATREAPTGEPEAGDGAVRESAAGGSAARATAPADKRAPAGAAIRRHQAPRLEPGPHVSAETARRIACDAGLVPMLHDRRGKLLDVGRRRRTVPPALRRALEHRDRECRFPGCAARFCDAHHLRHWAQGGQTRLDNLILLCRRHHRLLHEEGWRVVRGADGQPRFLRPGGEELPAVPEAPPVPEEPAAALQREQRGLGIDAWTATTRWIGDPLDIDWALFTLRRPARADHVPAETRDGDVPAETTAAGPDAPPGAEPARSDVSAETTSGEPGAEP